MLSLITKFFLQFMNPLGFVAFVLFVTLFLIKKKPKTAIWFVLICLLVLGVLGNPYFSTFLTRSMEWRHMPSPNPSRADVILLLADGVSPAHTPRQRVELDDQADRAVYAAQLYQQQVAPFIIVSGGQLRTDSTKTLLMELGVPEEALLIQDESSNMRNDVAFSSELIQSSGFKDILLLTSALQMDRAMFLFKDSGLNVIPAPTDYEVTLNEWQALTSWDWRDIVMNVVPNSEALQQTFNVLWEYFGLTYYRIRSII